MDEDLTIHTYLSLDFFFLGSVIWWSCHVWLSSWAFFSPSRQWRFHEWRDGKCHLEVKLKMCMVKSALSFAALFLSLLLLCTCIENSVKLLTNYTLRIFHFLRWEEILQSLHKHDSNHPSPCYTLCGYCGTSMLIKMRNSLGKSTAMLVCVWEKETNAVGESFYCVLEESIVGLLTYSCIWYHLTYVVHCH